MSAVKPPSRILNHLRYVLDKRRLKQRIVPLTVAVIGSTGFTGRHVTIELLRRGHTILGISRTASAIGWHDTPGDRYILCMGAVRQVLLAFKYATKATAIRSSFLIVIGGTGSLIMSRMGHCRFIARSAAHMMKEYREILMKGERENEQQCEQMKHEMTNMDGFVRPAYCPGKRTGEYDVHMQYSLPLPSDIAIRKRMKWKHWTATADQSDDRPVPSYPTI
ncbi:hypothetical protein V1506DRAFT_555130 [Lipomyces tetrasporus]